MRSFLLAGLIAATSSALIAQNPGQNVQVAVQVTAANTTADTTGVSYAVTNLPTSTAPLWLYFVDAPGGVLRIARYTGPLRWTTGTSFGSRARAGWMLLHDYLAAGATTPDLHFDAIGVPGILTYWAGGYFPVPVGGDEVETDSTTIPDPFVVSMITGKTVGVEPWPSDRSAQALLARLRGLTQSSCSAPLNWITDPSLCGQLLADIDQAEVYRSNGQAPQAANSLVHYEGLISAGMTGGTVTSAAYWLLRANAEIVRARL
jgi:hypothetical protein